MSGLSGVSKEAQALARMHLRSHSNYMLSQVCVTGIVSKLL